MMKNNRIAVLFFAALVLGGCAVVEAGESGISVRHSAANSALILSKAEKHCQSHGKRAELVQVSPIENRYLVQTVVSTFECI